MAEKIGAVLALTALAAIAVPTRAGAWDYPGHHVVGAVADLILQQQYPTTQKRVREALKIRLDGAWKFRTLEEAAVFPDCAKNDGFCGRPPSPEEEKYVARNKHHGRYHYTDVPLQQKSYVADSAGTGRDDVVQMIGYAVGVLRGKAPKKTGVELSKREAVWLLAHLVGDIHQPLHVGARYFDESCEKAVDPNVIGAGQKKFGIGKSSQETVGGNFIFLVAAPGVPPPPVAQLHLYWDATVVLRAMEAAGVNDHSVQEYAKKLVAEGGAGSETSGAAETWAAQWATEALPLAAEAHDRLTIHKGTRPRPFGVGCTWETTVDGDYEKWAKGIAHAQLAKAGFRLAALLRAIYP